MIWTIRDLIYENREVRVGDSYVKFQDCKATVSDEQVGYFRNNSEFQILNDTPEIIRPQASDKADVNLVCTLWASNGMGRVGEEILLSLDKLGLRINIQTVILEKEGLQKRTLELLGKTYKPSEITLFYAIPQMLLKYHTEKNYLYVPWDTTKAPKEWVEIINKYCTKVFTCSDFTKEVLEKSGVKPSIEIYKHGVRADLFPLLDRARTVNHPYTFLTCGDLSTRKGIDVLFDAFELAFPKNENVNLIVKSNKTMEWGGLKVPKDHRIDVITEPWPQEKFLLLFKEADCFIFPSRSEGFGLPVVEAMSTGLPVIFNNWSGLKTMANEKYNYPLEPNGTTTPDKRIYPDSYFEGEGIGLWGEPDLVALIKKMRYVYEHQEEAKQKGLDASKWVHRSWDWDGPITEIWNTIIGKKKVSWGEFYKENTKTKKDVQDCVNAHKELFWIIKGFAPKTILESGCGTGEMSAFLTWPRQEHNGKVASKSIPEKVIATELDKKVLKLADENIHAVGGDKVELKHADVFTDKTKADLIFSQGLLEHFNNEQLRELITHQLEQAPILVHSVPNNNYPKHDFGNERLMTDEEWYGIFQGFDITVYRYWGTDDFKTQSILVFKRPNIGPKVSIIMPVFNNKDMTIKAIDLAKKYSKDYELIVIDNNSTDGTGEWLDSQEGIKVVHVSENLGVPRAKNIAMTIASGEYICFLDNDAFVGEGWLEPMYETLEDKSVGFTGLLAANIDKEHKSFNGPNVGLGEMCDWCGHSVFMFRRKILKEIGLLLARGKWCCEDVDQCLKMWRLGYRGKTTDRPINVEHKGSFTAKGVQDGLDAFIPLYKKLWDEWAGFINSHNRELKIDIGVGYAPADNYLHVDIQPINHVEIIADARDLPFPDDCADEVRNSHLLEHFWRDEVPTLIREWHRILKVGGLIRISCPDELKIFRDVASGTVSTEQGLLWTYGGHRDSFDIHHWGWTEESIKTLFPPDMFSDVQVGHDGEGWLLVTARKVGKAKPIIGIFDTHHHVYGGGEKAYFQLIASLQKYYSDVKVICESHKFDLEKDFGIQSKPFDLVQDGTFDTFINCSFSELKPPKGKKNIAYVFYPMFDWSEGIKQYQSIVTLSEFSKDEIKRKWGVDSEVIYPAININDYHIFPKKKQILSVGRFFEVEGGNNKKHEVLIEAFKKMPSDWKLIFVGSIQNQPYYDRIVERAKGLNIEFKHDIPFSELLQLYSESSHLWHAAGYEAKDPSECEHFGMVAIEALASGCQPVVYNAGGIAEIKGVKTWEDISELISKTQEAFDVDELRGLSKIYDLHIFEKKWRNLIDA